MRCICRGFLTESSGKIEYGEWPDMGNVVISLIRGENLLFDFSLLDHVNHYGPITAINDNIRHVR